VVPEEPVLGFISVLILIGEGNIYQWGYMRRMLGPAQKRGTRRQTLSFFGCF
jgi:hypothetical protein